MGEATGTDRWHVIVYYDGLCQLCRGGVATLKRFDWLNAIRPVSFHAPGVIARDGLSLARLTRRMQSRTAGGGPIREGIDAVIQIAWRVPALWPALPLLLVARLLGIGQAAYDFVSARRHGALGRRSR
jgi:predicted DCC family thiol-disulfide oxidoreductase YuxK